jgi:hypothetical protein
MLPPLLSLLLECAKKTDQTVVSIALGALVHLIEVGGHQFSDGDWETLLKSIRYFLKFFLPKYLLLITHYLFIYLFIIIVDLTCQGCIIHNSAP